jgi:hypothetical protein
MSVQIIVLELKCMPLFKDLIFLGANLQPFKNVMSYRHSFKLEELLKHNRDTVNLGIIV